MFFQKEAQECRRKALEYRGKPEGPFLLKVAQAFEDLERRDSKRNRAIRA